LIHRRGPWRSVEVVELATLEWVDWFNKRRLLSSIGNIPPVEAAATYWACQEGQAIAAWSKRNSLRSFWSGSWRTARLDAHRY
jgi:hypothetical protein